MSRNLRRANHHLNWTGLEALEDRQLLDAINVAITTSLPLITASTRPTLAGTVDDNMAEVQVTLKKGQTTVATFDALEDESGGWTLTIPNRLHDGTYDLVVSASDNDGADTGETTYTRALKVDALPPVVTVDGLTTNVASPQLTGTINDDTATVSINVNGADYAAVNNGDGTWTLDGGQIAALTEGTYDVTATATDVMAHQSTDNTTNELVIDLTGPTVGVDALNSNATSPQLTGTVDDPAATVVVTVNAADYTATNNGDGSWTLDAGQIADLDDGQYTVTAVATDAANNASAPGQATLNIDTALPTVTVDTLATNIPSPQLTGTVDDNAATISVNVNGGDYAAVNNGDGTWMLASGQIASLPDGAYDVTVTATDSFNNVGTDATTDELTIDATPPAVTVDSLDTNNTSPPLTGTVDDDGATISVNVNGADYAAVNNADGTWMLDGGQIAALAEGTYDVTVTATDALGNAGTDATTKELVVDLTAPSASGQMAVTADSSPALSGSVDDPTATISITVGAATYDAVNNGDSTWSLDEGAITPLPDGLYKVLITATDPAGNQSTSNEYLVVDATAPAAGLDKLITADTTPQLTGTVDDPGATIQVMIGEDSYDAVNNGDGTWTLADNSVAALSRGWQDVTLTATDALGNSTQTVVSDRLGIANTVNVTLGSTIFSVAYVDGDGTQVTLSSGKGNLTASFTGMNATTSGTGKSRKVTAEGGIVALDIVVSQNTASLAFKTGKGGDGATSIHSITGSGILSSLTGSKVMIGDEGVDMAGCIQSMNVYAIDADVSMADTVAGKGVSITAKTVSNCQIAADYIKMLNITQSFANADILASAIQTATLTNVQTSNDGTTFGLHTESLTKLTLKRGSKKLVWNTDFTDGIDDFVVDLIV